MASVQELEQALRAADASGNVDDARMLAGALQRARAATPAPKPEPMLTREQLSEVAGGARFAGTPQGAFIDKYGDAIKSAAIQGGPPAVGQAIGAPLAPFTFGAAPVVLGAAGGLGGYLADAYRTGNVPTMGGAITSTIMGGIPGAPFAQGVKAVAKQAVKQGAMNLIAAEGQNAIDNQEFLSARDAALSFAGGAGGVVGAKAVGKAVGAGVKAAPKTQQEVLDEFRIESAKEIRRRGGAIPPRYIGRGSDLMAGLAEQASLNQAISRKNAPILQQMVREDLGLTGSGPIRNAPSIGSQKVPNDIRAYIAKQYEPYESLRKYGFNPDELKAMRLKQRDAMNSRQANAGWRDEYEKATQAIDAWETAAIAAAKAQGDDTVVDRLKSASGNIARAYAIDSAIGRSSGIIDPAALGALVEAGVPLSGNARRVADFHNSFYTAATDVTRMPPPGIKGLGTNVGMMMAAQGNPSGLAGAGIKARAGSWARERIMSDEAQNRFLAPRVDYNKAANAVQLIPLYGGQGVPRNRFLWQEEEQANAR